MKFFITNVAWLRSLAMCLLCFGLQVSVAQPAFDPASEPPSEPLEQVLDDTALEHAQKHLDPKYVCPMHPQIIKNDPGSCPICGMDLVKKMIDVNAGKYPEVKVQNAVIQTMGIRTEKAGKDTIWKFIKTVGRVDYDETTQVHLHPKAEGWMEKLYLRAEGDRVKKGEMIGEFYSPEILSAQLDYIIALQQTSKSKALKAKNRLRLLGVSEATINSISKSRQSQNHVPVLSPSDGIVTKLFAREGMYLKPDKEFLTIAGLSKVWVWVDIFEHQISWIKTGIPAEIKVPAYPGKKWEGKLDYIYPELDPESRTLRARLVFDNPDMLLKANMFAEVTIYGGPKRDVLVVPSESVIETGQRSSVVKVIGEGLFQPVDVVLGIQRNGKTEILSGLEEGDEIVTSGQFLIDSESSLQASFIRMTEGQ